MEDLIPLIVSLILAHPRGVAYVSIAIAVLTVVANVWQAIPVATREAWERRYPRPIGALRTFVELGINIVKSQRIARHQAIAGQPRLTEPAPVTKPPPAPGLVEPPESQR